jgi:hypothetical protein
MKGRFDLQRNACGAFCDGVEFGKVQQGKTCAAVVGAVAGPGEGIDIDAFERLVLQRLSIRFKVTADDRKFSFGPRSTK